MLLKGARSFEVTVQCLDTKFIWENGETLMQCRDKGHWKTMTKFEVRNSMAYASMQTVERVVAKLQGYEYLGVRSLSLERETSTGVF